LVIAGLTGRDRFTPHLATGKNTTNESGRKYGMKAESFLAAKAREERRQRLLSKENRTPAT